MGLEILAYKCKKCGHLMYPLRMVCNKCRKNEPHEFDTVPMPKTGKLLTYTHVYNLPPDFMVAKLGLGIVELDNGLRMTGQIRIPNPTMGMRVMGKVEIVKEAEYDKTYGMIFYPEAAEPESCCCGAPAACEPEVKAEKAPRKPAKKG
ncbi:MAG: OB-fold domain-containing protein [Candidatus Riflebacteria bacterium]|nr:OB-fold domain-containing protein [Candidatus Riflebacteria bacterium]